MMNKHDIEITAMQLIKSNMKNSPTFVHKTLEVQKLRTV